MEEIYEIITILIGLFIFFSGKAKMKNPQRNSIKMYKQQEINLIKEVNLSLQNFNGGCTVIQLFNWLKILFIPQNKWIRKIPTSKIDIENWGIDPDNI